MTRYRDAFRGITGMRLVRGFGVAAMSGAAMLLVQSAGAQVRPETQDDYSDLMRRATDGRDPVVEKVPPPQVQTAPEHSAASRAEPRSASLDAVDGDEVAATPMRLHSPSEYADEPHSVSVVDRSRYAAAFRPTTLANTMGLVPGSILVDTKARQLYFAIDAARVRRYGVAVGKHGMARRPSAGPRAGRTGIRPRTSAARTGV
jgi:lipoprotein-anchoring transpeptidase ErfK/SrfK